MRQLKSWCIVTHNKTYDTYEVQGYDEHGNKHDVRGVINKDDPNKPVLITEECEYLLVNPA